MRDTVLKRGLRIAESYLNNGFAVEITVRIFDLPHIIPQAVLMWKIRIEPNAVSVNERTSVNGFWIHVFQIFRIHKITSIIIKFLLPTPWIVLGRNIMGISPLKGTPWAAYGSIIIPFLLHRDKAHHVLFEFLCWSLAQKSLRSWRQKTSRSDKNGKFHSIDIQLSSYKRGLRSVPLIYFGSRESSSTNSREVFHSKRTFSWKNMGYQM